MPPPADGFAARFVLGPALRAQPDRRLVSLVRDGYETAFEEIVRRYGKPLTRYAAAIVGARSEDVTQDAFSKALLALRRDGAEIELRPWLFRIVRNTALNELRDNPPSPEVIAGGSNPAEEIERREELADLMRRLRLLPEPQRAAIVMREMEGLSHEEIAAALGVSGGAARQAIHRARQALRNGAGMLVPLPLLQALLAGGTTGTAEVAAGAGGVAGAGVALKAAAATVLVAGAVGAGVAIHDNRHDGRGQQPAAASKSAPADNTAPPTTGGGSGSEGEPGDDHGRGEREPGDDHGGHGKEPDDDHGGRSGDDHQGGHIEAVGDDHVNSNSGSSDHGGRSGASGTGRGGPGPSGDDGGSGGSDGGRGSSQGGTSSHGGGRGPSGGSGDAGSGGSGDDPASGGGSGSSSGPGPGESQEPTAPTVDSVGGPGPGEGSGSGGESGPGDGSGGGGDNHGGD